MRFYIKTISKVKKNNFISTNNLKILIIWIFEKELVDSQKNYKKIPSPGNNWDVDSNKKPKNI